jgi:signal transduction histidine kinase
MKPKRIYTHTQIEQRALTRGLLVGFSILLTALALLYLRYQSAVRTLDEAYGTEALRRAEFFALTLELDRRGHGSDDIHAEVFFELIRRAPDVRAAFLVDSSNRAVLLSHDPNRYGLPTLTWQSSKRAQRIAAESLWLVQQPLEGERANQLMVLRYADADYQRRLGQIRAGFGFVITATGFGALFFGLAAYLLLKRKLLAQRAAEQLEQARDRSEQANNVASLAAVVAHEFSQHLTVISGQLDLAAIGANPNTSAELDVAQSSVALASDTIEQLRAIAGARFNSLLPHRLQDIAEQAHTRLRRRGVQSTITLDVAGSHATVTTDDAKATTALVQLLRNAVEASGSASVTITEYFDARGFKPVFALPIPVPGAAVLVRNPGELSADVASQLGKAFFTSKGSGRGWGLTVVQGVCKTVGGALVWRNHAGHTEMALVFALTDISSV